MLKCQCLLSAFSFLTCSQGIVTSVKDLQLFGFSDPSATNIAKFAAAGDSSDANENDESKYKALVDNLGKFIHPWIARLRCGRASAVVAVYLNAEAGPSRSFDQVCRTITIVSELERFGFITDSVVADGHGSNTVCT